MGKKINEVGNRYGRLLVIKEDPQRNNHGLVKGICQCDCGNICSVVGSYLRSGRTQSCGCYNKDRVREVSGIDMTGQKFGLLTVLEVVHDHGKKTQRQYWKCQCECGNIVIVDGHHLRTGHTKSCGCVKSFGQKTINTILQQLKIDYQTEQSFPGLVSKKGRKLRYDFALFEEEKIIGLIEFDGSQHFEQDNIGHTDTLDLYDELKNKYAQEHKIPLLRVCSYNADTIKHMIEHFVEDCYHV